MQFAILSIIMLIGSAAEDKRLLRIVQQVTEREVSGDAVDPMEAAALVVTIRCVPVRKFDGLNCAECMGDTIKYVSQITQVCRYELTLL